MPFDEESEEIVSNKKIGIKQVSSQKSIFEKQKEEDDKKPKAQDFEKKVEEINKKNNDYKTRAAELAISYKKIILDKTLPQNKSVFLEEVEKETLSKMIALAVEINNDQDEQEGMGTLGWVTLLLKYFLHHRDRINTLEYQLLESKREINKLKEIVKVDAPKKSE